VQAAGQQSANIPLPVHGRALLENPVAAECLPLRAERVVQPYDAEIRCDGQRQRGAETGGVETIALRGIVAVGHVFAPECIDERIEAEPPRIARRVALRPARLGAREVVVANVSARVADTQYGLAARH